MGIPFPEDALKCIDNVRLLNSQGKNIPVQTTEVTTFLPSSPNMKWAWIIFFSEDSLSYTLEFSPNVSHKLFSERLVSKNDMRLQGGISVNTDLWQFTIDKKEIGFLDQVRLSFYLIDLDFRQLG